MQQPVPRRIIGQSRDMGRLLTGPRSLGTLFLEYQSARSWLYALVTLYSAEVLQDSRNPPLSPPSARAGRSILRIRREAKRNVEQPTGEVTSRRTVGGGGTRPRGEYKITLGGWREGRRSRPQFATDGSLNAWSTLDFLMASARFLYLSLSFSPSSPCSRPMSLFLSHFAPHTLTCGPTSGTFVRYVGWNFK